MARRGRCAPARSTAKSPTAFAANGAPRSTPISDPSSKPHGEDRSEPSTPSASPSRAAPCLAQLENVNGDLSNYLETALDARDSSETHYRTVISTVGDGVFKVLKSHSELYIIKIHGTIVDIKTIVFSRSEYVKLAFGNPLYN